jgi:hypothetical protein
LRTARSATPFQLVDAARTATRRINELAEEGSQLDDEGDVLANELGASACAE